MHVLLLNITKNIQRANDKIYAGDKSVVFTKITIHKFSHFTLKRRILSTMRFTYTEGMLYFNDIRFFLYVSNYTQCYPENRSRHSPRINGLAKRTCRGLMTKLSIFICKSRMTSSFSQKIDNFKLYCIANCNYTTNIYIIIHELQSRTYFCAAKSTSTRKYSPIKDHGYIQMHNHSQGPNSVHA